MPVHVELIHIELGTFGMYVLVTTKINIYYWPGAELSFGNTKLNRVLKTRRQENDFEQNTCRRA